MKRLLLILISLFLFSSCSRVNGNIKNIFSNNQIDRIVVSNSKSPGRYTIVDQETIDRFKNRIIKSTQANKDTKLDSDFQIEFYSGIKRVAAFKYIAGITDSKEVNLIDENGTLYNTKSSIEEYFLKRLLKKNLLKNVQEYYTSLIELLIEKASPSEGNVVVVDITKDSYVVNTMTSVEQRNMVESINEKDVDIKYPSEAEKWDFYIKITTSYYTGTESTTTATVNDTKNGLTRKFILRGSFNKNWSYNIDEKK